MSPVAEVRRATTGEVRLAKGWEWDRAIPALERDAILTRILLLPAWVDNQLDAANLDVRGLEGSEGFLRLRVGDYRVLFERVGRDVVIHRVGRRADVYESLQSLVLVRSGDGLRLLHTAQPEIAETPTPRRPLVRRAAQFDDVQNPLTPFTDDRLAAAGLAPAEIAALRRVPAEATPDEVIAARAVDARVVRLVAELWERPAHYLELLDDGVALDDEARAPGRGRGGRAQPPLETISRTPRFLTVSDLAAFSSLARPAGRGLDGLPSPGAVTRGDFVARRSRACARRCGHRQDRCCAAQGAPPRGATRRSIAVDDLRQEHLPTVWGGLFEIFAPEVRGRIEMRTVDSVGYGDLQRKAVARSLRRRITTVPRRSSRSCTRSMQAGWSDGGLSWAQLLDEFTTVIEGRGLENLDAYLSLPRTGRGSALPASPRRHV